MCNYFSKTKFTMSNSLFFLVTITLIVNILNPGNVSSQSKGAEWFINMIKDSSTQEIDEDTEIFEQFNISNTEIENMTCITEKFGVGYMGQKSTTKDGEPCIMWSLKSALYIQYMRQGKNVPKNFCRNPDNDQWGPWCLIKSRTISKKEFNYKSCGIPMCSVTPVTYEYKMGAPMFYGRNCPTGFQKYNKTFCVVKQDYLDKLPNGSYSLEALGEERSPKCFKGFGALQITTFNEDKTTVLCNRRRLLNETIDIPNYIKPNYGDLIFISLSIAEICPTMNGETSVVYMKAPKVKYILCYYFYKLSNNKYREDRQLAFLTVKRDCPNGWSLKRFDHSWLFKLPPYQRRSTGNVNACIPDKAITEFPDGNYCLISSQRLSQIRLCPKEFVSVSLNRQHFCCRQSLLNDGSNMKLYKFLNFSSVLIINNGNNCHDEVTDMNIRVNKLVFMSRISFSDCKNCDLVKAFTTRGGLTSFTACNYERVINGFGYASLNSRCPPEMDFSSIQFYYASRFRYAPYIPSLKFCTKLNYPNDIQFPRGKYCIYKMGYICPQGFVSNRAPLPIIKYEIKSNNGNVPNFEADSYCCKDDSIDSDFTNAKLPYVTNNFEFGLPFPNVSYHCVHGLSTHTAVEDTHMCQYYPRSGQRPESTLVYPSTICFPQSYNHYGHYRLIFSKNTDTKYCYLYIKNVPPVGKYCTIFAKKCPSKYFDYITYHPVDLLVICCRKNVSNETQAEESKFTLSEWLGGAKQFFLLAYKRKCEVFKGYNYGRVGTSRENDFLVRDLPEDYKRNLTSIGVRISNSNDYIHIVRCFYQKDPHNKSTTWPHGKYAFPKTLMNCPSHFKTGFFSHSMESASPSFSHSDIIHLDGDYMIGGSTLTWGFCVKNNRVPKDNLALPRGRYCLMQVEHQCPRDFKQGSVKFVEITAMSEALIKRNGSLPDIVTDGPYINYTFCCQTGYGDIAHAAMELPIDSGPFYLFKYGTYCQRVSGMKVTEEFICIDSEDSPQYLNYTFLAPYKIEGFTPITGSYSRGCDFQINMCYYDKDTQDSQTATARPGPSQGWPRGSYLFMKALLQDCPPLFDERKIPIRAKFKISLRFLNTLMFGDRGSRGNVLTYCERNSTSLDTLYPPEEWPKGTYCVIFEKNCPQGLLRYKFKSINTFVSAMFYHNLCCKKDNVTNVDDLPFFPAEQYSFFILPTYDLHTCPPHKNMRVALINLQSEIMCYYEKKDKTVEFPDGDYLFPAPAKSSTSCPPGFKFVKHYHSTVTGADLPSKELKFCQKQKTGSSLKKFPRGNYCVLTTNKICPSNQFTTENYLVIPLFKFSEQKDVLSRYLACCQNDSNMISNIGGMKVPFQMFGSKLCSYVDGMINVNEVQVATDLVQRGVYERPPYIMSSNRLRVCRYDQSSLFDYDAKCHCHRNATCVITVDDTKCRCNSGFFGDGIEICVEVTNSTNQCANVCNIKRSECIKSKNSEVSVCKCKEGFEGNGLACKPSCNTRQCNPFSHCVLNSTDSFCACSRDSVLAPNGQCHGDLISTTTLLNGFDILQDLNWTCLSNRSYNHLMQQHTNGTLIIFLSYNSKTVFQWCMDTLNHIALVKEFAPGGNFMWKQIVQTEGDYTLLVTVDDRNRWKVNEYIDVIRIERFTNAIVLYLNHSIRESWLGMDPNTKMVSKDPVIAAYTFGVLLSLAFVALVIVCVLRRNRMFGFNNLRETRSESNIHFFSAEDKVEIDS